MICFWGKIKVREEPTGLQNGGYCGQNLTLSCWGKKGMHNLQGTSSNVPCKSYLLNEKKKSFNLFDSSK